MSDEPPLHAARGPSPTGASLAGLRLDELLGEVQDRLTEIVKTRDRLQGLLDAVLAVGAGLELDGTLQRIEVYAKEAAAAIVTTERAIAEGTRSRWQGNDQQQRDTRSATPCRRDCVARRIA